MTNIINTIWSGRAALGESATWDSIDKKLYWIDITKGHINCLNVISNQNEFVEVVGMLGTVVVRSKNTVLATLDNKIISLNFLNKKTETLITVFSEEYKNLRMNDGKCDARGRFWIGVANTSKDKNARGALYCYDLDGKLTIREDDVVFSNGLTWSPDNKKFYHVDTARFCIYVYDFDLSKGTISNRSILFNLKETGKPDGLTVDREGFLWLAVYDGRKLLRLSPNGEIDKFIQLPILRPTSCIFGGENENTLFVTSCSRDVDEKQTLPFPNGNIFTIQLGVGGLSEPRFIG